MEITKGKISMRQVYIIFILALASPSLRAIPNYVVGISKQASWLSPIVCLVPAILTILLIAGFFKKYPDKSLYDVFEISIGKIATKIVSAIYILWFIVLLGTYLRLFAERFLATILVGSSLEIILAVMAVFIFFTAGGKIETVGRLMEILLILFAAIFIGVFIFIIPDIKMENLLPITYYDAWPLVKSAVPILALSSYIVPFMFVGEDVTHKEKIKSNGIKTMIFLGIMAVMIIMSTVGVNGAEICQQFIFPYFITLKGIEILNSIERIESIFIATWIATDFAIIIMLMLSFLGVSKNFFKIKNKNSLIMPICFFMYVFAIYVGNNYYEIEKFASRIGGPLNVVLFFLFPAIIYFIGKLRKKL